MHSSTVFLSLNVANSVACIDSLRSALRTELCKWSYLIIQAHFLPFSIFRLEVHVHKCKMNFITFSSEGLYTAKHVNYSTQFSSGIIC